MPDEADITADLVRRVAQIAGLDLDQSRANVLAPQIQTIRADMRALGDIDLTDVEPLVFPSRPERPGER